MVGRQKDSRPIRDAYCMVVKEGYDLQEVKVIPRFPKEMQRAVFQYHRNSCGMGGALQIPDRHEPAHRHCVVRGAAGAADRLAHRPRINRTEYGAAEEKAGVRRYSQCNRSARRRTDKCVPGGDAPTTGKAEAGSGPGGSRRALSAAPATFAAHPIADVIAPVLAAVCSLEGIFRAAELGDLPGLDALVKGYPMPVYDHHTGWHRSDLRGHARIRAQRTCPYHKKHAEIHNLAHVCLCVCSLWLRLCVCVCVCYMARAHRHAACARAGTAKPNPNRLALPEDRHTIR
eukprot:2024687-Rhodomonas_salina.1